MKYPTKLVFIIQLLVAGSVAAQESPVQRIILIGDAGENNKVQQAIIHDAATKAIAGPTIALFLGDNVYPRGFLTDSNGRKEAEDILRSQYKQLRERNIPVFFVPGNHDWDKSGPRGLEKMVAANQFIVAQGDGGLQMAPRNAEPGPVVVRETNDMLVLAMDSEWWLYKYDKTSAEQGAAPATEATVLLSLSKLIAANRDKWIIFATHHPFITYGSHGGYYSLIEHLFPLTDANKYLFIPFPILGSLYPLSRNIFPPQEDLKNARYQHMIKSVDSLLRTHVNTVHVSGHEHTLQLIKGDVLQVVSGAGCKHTPVKKGRGSIFAAAKSGYATLDLMADKSVVITWYTSSSRGLLAEAFRYVQSAVK